MTLRTIAPVPEPDTTSSGLPTGAEHARAWAERYTGAHTENFSVLSRFVPRELRPDFASVYAFCRAADDLADETGNDAEARRRSLELLGEFRAATRRAFAGEATEPLFVALSETIRRHRLPIAPFDDLIAAFELDQTVTRHQTWRSLVDYSRGSANPVGRLVLMLCGYRPPEEEIANAERYARSDAVCTALQLTNFWQDVRRDLIERDRVYLPLAEIGLSVEELRAWMSAPVRAEDRERYRVALRSLVARTWELFDEGRPLAATLRGDIAPVIRLFQAGGEAILHKIAAMEFDTLWRRPRIGKVGKVWLVAKEWGGWGDSMAAVGREADVAAPVVDAPGARGITRSKTSGRRVIVVGGGLAGLSAAIRLADAGVPVLLLEAKRRLGGRATSFVDQATGETLDNCQHVALGCCTAYLDFCRRLGAMDSFDWYAEQYWFEAGGRESILRPGILPAPAHYTEAFLAAKFLAVTEKLAIGRAMLAIGVTDRRDYIGRTFGDFLREQVQPRRAIDRFWSPIIVSACNMSVERVAASPALKVFQEGFLAPGMGARAGLIGIPRVPLVRLYDRATAAIAEAGGEVRLGANVERVWADGVQLGGEMIGAGAVICALPVERACRVVAPEAQQGDSRFAAMAGAEFSPILGVHIEFDRPVLARPHAVLVDRPTQWLFRKDVEGRRLHAVISAADDWVDLPEDEIVRRVAGDCEACLPAARGARVVWSRAVKERRATFAATPEFDRGRPNVTPTRKGGVILAGDYTATDWPATMEGATRSGLAAAAACGVFR